MSRPSLGATRPQVPRAVSRPGYRAVLQRVSVLSSRFGSVPDPGPVGLAGGINLYGYAGGRGNLPPDESNPLNSLIDCYAQTSAEEVVTEQLDADYAERGYENRKGSIIPDRARVLHFGNLPAKCKISVYSLDGDLIGVRHHDYPEDDPMAMHDTWNLVSRAGLAVKSGLYYWVVESAGRTQLGKFVIIK